MALAEQYREETGHEVLTSVATVTKKVASVTEVMEFVVENKGIVMPEWVTNPTKQRQCKVIFPPSVRKARQYAGTSVFIKKVLDTFYPRIDARRCGTYYATVPMEGDRVFIAMDSDLERRLGTSNDMSGFAPHGYSHYLKKAQRWTFLGHAGVLLSKE